MINFDGRGGQMLNYWISVSFLILLLIPIGFFQISLIYLTGQQMRKNPNQNTIKSKYEVIDDIPQKQRLRIVK